MYCFQVNEENVIIQAVKGGTPEELTQVFGGRWFTSETKVFIGGMRLEDGTLTPRRPYPSWFWDGDAWRAPTPKPDDGQEYQWNEETQSWEQV